MIAKNANQSLSKERTVVIAWICELARIALGIFKRSGILMAIIEMIFVKEGFGGRFVILVSTCEFSAGGVVVGLGSAHFLRGRE